jgi:hypothetical protein
MRIAFTMRGLAAALFFFMAATISPADDTIGSLTYAEGDVALIRNGEEIASLSIGQKLQNFDLVKTGSDGLLEMDVSPPAGPRFTVKVSADTQFSLEVATLKGTQQTTVGIIGGSIALKVSKLVGAQTMSVRTDSTVMGVRGTQFTVTAPATGDILVTCDEGDVVCSDATGREIHAIPGTAVENRLTEAFRATAIKPAEAGPFAVAWAKDRAGALEKNALTLIRANARLYLQLSRDLTAANSDLAKSQAIVTKWSEEDRTGRIGQRAEIIRERAVLGGIIARLRQIQFRMERIEFRLDRLRTVHDRGIGKGSIDAGMTTTLFFQQVDRERKDLQKRLALTRFLAKLYAKRSNGELP